MKVNFDFILLLALGAIIDSHVKLRRASMEVKSHKKSLDEDRDLLQIATSRP
jgi:hypothetical protein